MRDDASAFEKSKAGSGQQHGVRSSKLRKTRLRALALEPLEARTLMSTLPPVTTASRTAISTATTGNSDAPSIAIDPNDPLKMVAVWVRNDPSNPKGPGSTTPTTAFVEAAYSTKGGVTGSWNPVPAGSLGNRTGPTYPLVTDASVAFDAHDNFFITDLAHTPDYAAGQLDLERFHFDNTGITQTLTDAVGTQWTAATGAAYKPVLAVDANQSSYIDPNNPLYSQTDAQSDLVVGGMHYGAVYLAWTSTFNANSRAVLASSYDGGQTFSAKPVSGVGLDQASAPTLAISQGRPADTAGHGANDKGITGGQVTVIWDDLGNLDNGRDRLMESISGGNEQEIGTTSVRGAVNGANFPNAATQAASPIGFGPAPSLASDNTLGQSSPYSGRLYLAYVDRDTAGANPPDNTDIRSIYSDDGGQTWSSPAKVNDDNANSDGFSEAGLYSGRPQFEPRAAVDPATGTVVVSYLDTRNDAARARTAYYINTSITGGATFGPGAYANASKTAVDAITTNTVVLGPIPDNQSAGNTTTRDPLFGFGDHQGLAVYDGNIYPVWASNSNGGNDGNQGLGIVLGHTQTANGPRVVTGTSGPVGEPNDPLNSTRNTAGDGGPEVSAIRVVLDRPVNPDSGPVTFDASNIQFAYFDVSGVPHLLGSLPATVKGIVTNPNDPSQNGHFGYTTFEVDLTTPLTQVGAYTYTIAGTPGKPISTNVQFFNGSGFQLTEPFSQGSFTIPTPSATDSLPLIVSGPHVLNTTQGVVVQNLKAGSTDNEVLNNSVSYVDVTFDRDMNTGAANFTPADVLRIEGPAGSIPGPFTVTPLNTRTFRVGFPTQSLSGTYSITLAASITDAKGDPLDTNLNAGLYEVRGVNPYATATPHTYKATDTPVAIPGGVANPPSPPTPSLVSSFITVPDNFIVQDASVQLDISYPNDPDLKVSLVGPDGTAFVLINHLGAPGSANFSGTAIGDKAGSSTTLDQGAAPFFGSFLPQAGAGSLGVTFGNGTYKSLGKWQLLIENDGTGTGTLNSWSLTLSSKLPAGIGSTGLGEPVADQATAHFRIFVDDPASPVSSTTWTSVGPSPVVNSNNGAIMSGRIGAIAVDPSDPSGNTVYAGGASGGVWKTTDFMTQDSNGPTWTPLTDFGPTAGINVGTITVIPQGNDPTKSIVLVGLGDPDVGKKGYGFLRSTDGGATFELLDSTNNTGAFGSRDHTFSANDTVVNKIAFDPVLNNTKQHILYAALGGSGASAGLWRSLDTGTTWTQLSNPSLGAATDVTLDPVSGQGVSGGNLQILYASFPGSGVYSSPNQGTSLFLMSGTTGDPLIRDRDNGTVAVNLGPAPTGVVGGKILLAKPAVVNSSDPSNPGVEDKLYEGWLYALVTNPAGFDGLYLTKDYGQNWTKIALPVVDNGFGVYPSNNEGLASYGAGASPGGVSFAIDPTNPNVVYIGGGNGGEQPGFLRVDATAVFDAHNFVGLDGNGNDGGKLQVNTTGGVALSDPANHPSAYLVDPNTGRANPVAYLNLIRDPKDPFAVNSTLQTQFINSASGFTNSGAKARLFTYYSTSQNNPNSGAFNKSGGQHRLATFVDPQTGHARLIFGDNQGIFTGVDDKGSLIGGVGPLPGPLGSRNGNLSITQFFYGAVQPSAHNSATNSPMAVLFYGGVSDVGVPASHDVLNTGDLSWSGPGGSSSVVQTDPTGSGAVYRTVFQNGTNFFTVNDVGRTFGLLQGPTGGNFLGAPLSFNGGATVFGNFTVNSVNGNQILISDRNGTVFRTEDQGKNWHAISDPFGSYAPAVAFGAPDPNAPNGIGNLDNFIYAGTLDGRVFVSQTGGGGGSGNSSYADISRGLDGSTVQQIITDPARGSHDAFAVTLAGVYYMPNSIAPGATWLNITNDLFQKTTPSYGNVAEQTRHLFTLTSIQADWRYALPYSTLPPGAVVTTHPVLYVAGEGGVYRTLDNGQSWTNFPNQAIDNAPSEGGYLPNLRVGNLTQATGNINSESGRAVYQAGDPNILVASTFGRGQFEIQLSPTVIPNTAALPNVIALDPISLFKTANNGTAVTISPSPVIDGLSEETVFGTVAHVALLDLTDPKNPQPVPLSGSDTTDANGRYQLHVNNYFAGKPNGTYTFGVQATDQRGAKGNVALYTFIYDAAAPAPTNVTLDPTTDSGTFNGDDYTNFNNSTPAAAPLFDVSGILPGATVYLVRATEVNGVLGAFTVVNSAVNTGTTTGVVKVADTNAGNGVIADTPVNPLVDTAPPQPNQNVYSAYQVDALNLQGPNYVPGLGVIIDATSPTAPMGVKLDAATDSGSSSADGYTNFNNATPAKAPLFDVTGIEPHATVELIRDTIDPKTGQPSGNPVVVNTLTNVTPTGANNLVRIADINAGKGAIPDNPVGTPGDTAPPVGTPSYTYTAIQLDLAGNVSKPSVTFGNRGAIVLDGTDSDLHGDSNGPGKTNENGWKYMQKVLQAIQPNTTNGQKILVALGTRDSGGTFGYAGKAIESAFQQSTLPGLGWTIVHVSGTANMDAFLSGKPANAVDSNDKAAGTITIAQTGLLYITTANETGDDLTDADLTMLDTHGPDIKAYLNTGGGLYTQCETNQADTVKGYGWLSAIFPGINYTSLGSDGEFPSNVLLTPAGTAIFPGLIPADLSTGPVHGYFGGTIPAALATVFTFDETTSKMTQPLGLSSVGGGSLSSGNLVIIDTTPPVTPGLSLDPASDTGTYANDDVTNRNNSPSPANAPVFDATNIEPNAVVELFRNGVLVNTITEGTTGGTAAIADINAPGNGTIPDGTYTYTVRQTDLAGNVGLTASLTVIINATPPAAPTPFALDPASDTGTFNNDGITKDNNGTYPAPLFDLSGIVNRATVKLYRAPVLGGVTGASVLVNTLTDTKGGTLTIADTNAGAGTIPDGTYVYTAQQVDLAGNPGPISGSVRVTIDTDGPQPAPAPAPSLEAKSDTGTYNNDQITQDNNSTTYPAPVFDEGTASFPVEAGATVQLFRAPVVNGVTGAAVPVNAITNSAGGIVAIADTNAGGGVIPDGTYLYTVQITDLAGVSGTRSPGQKVTILSSPPALPQPFRLDPGSDTGVSNSDGVTQITLVHQPVFDAGGVVPGGTVNLFRAPVDGSGNVGAAALVAFLQNTAGGTVKISDPTSPVDGQYVYTVQQIDLAGDASPIGGAVTVVYDTAQPTTTTAPTLDPASDTGVQGDNTTSSNSPTFDVNVTASGLEANSSLTLVRDGVAIAHSPYNLATGVATVQDPGPVPFGVHTYQTFLTDLAGNVGALSASTRVTFAKDPAGTLTLDPASDSGARGDNVTNVTSPTFDVVATSPNVTLELFRNGTLVASNPTGAGGNETITDKGPLTSGQYTYTTRQLDASNNLSPPSAPLVLTIDTTIPVTLTGFKLDPASDSGLKGDHLTNVNKLTFDASGVAPGASVRLTRDGVLVATLPSPSGGTVMITDPGPAPDGSHNYSVQQVSVAGNVSPVSAVQTVTIDTTTPAAPVISLDPASDTGVKGDNITAVLSPVLDLSSVAAGSTLQLYRNGRLIQTVPNATAGTDKVQDTGPLANGSYTYTAVQTNAAGTSSPAGSPLVVTINTTPPLVPTSPSLNLDPSTDSGVVGDGVTNSRLPVIDGNADPNVAIILYDGKGNTVGQATADASGNFSIAVTTPLADGVYAYQATATDKNNKVSPLTSPALSIRVVTVPGDFTGAGKTQLSVFRRLNANTIDWIVQNYGPINFDQFGVGSQDVPLSGDYEGDGRTDPLLYRPSTGQWFVQASSNGFKSQALTPFGAGVGDIPVPADYLGTGKFQEAIFKPGSGAFYVLGMAKPTTVVPGEAGDIPVPGNYDNTGKDEFAVYNPGKGVWTVLGPNGTHTINFGGGNGDVPVPGSYYANATSQAAGVAVWKPTTGQYVIQTPSGGSRIIQFSPGDIPAPGAYDGIGVTEAAVYRPSSLQWFVEGPNDTTPRLLASFGGSKDVPTLAPYTYRALPGTSGAVRAFGSPTGSLDLGATAQTLLNTGAAPATVAPAAQVRAMAASTVVPPAAPTTRSRPNQPSAASAVHHKHAHGRQHLSIIDKALDTVARNLARRHHARQS